MEVVTRRRALQQLGIVAGGVGVAGAAPLMLGAGPAASPLPRLVFSVPVDGLHVLGGAKRALGAQHVLSGTVSSAEASAVGFFHAVVTVVSGGGRFADPAAPHSLESHTFHLPAGTIIGQGATTHEGAGNFAVIGGTGAYHGAQGSYTGARTIGEFGGDKATYSFTLSTTEAHSNGR